MHDLLGKRHRKGKLEVEEDQQHENGQIMCEPFISLPKRGAQLAQEENFPKTTLCDFLKAYHCLILIKRLEILHEA